MRFGQFLRRPTTFGQGVRLSTNDTEQVISDLFAALSVVVRHGTVAPASLVPAVLAGAAGISRALGAPRPRPLSGARRDPDRPSAHRNGA